MIAHCCQVVEDRPGMDSAADLPAQEDRQEKDRQQHGHQGRDQPAGKDGSQPVASHGPHVVQYPDSQNRADHSQRRRHGNPELGEKIERGRFSNHHDQRREIQQRIDSLADDIHHVLTVGEYPQRDADRTDQGGFERAEHAGPNVNASDVAHIVAAQRISTIAPATTIPSLRMPERKCNDLSRSKAKITIDAVIVGIRPDITVDIVAYPGLTPIRCSKNVRIG